MDEQDTRFLKITLDDAIIKATNEDGERLRFAVTVEGKEVLLRFPAYGDWDNYVRDLAKLFVLLAQTGGDIELDSNLVSEEHFQDWAYVTSEVLKYKEVKDLVEKIFMEYLRPRVKGVDNVKNWLRSNMDISHLFYIFQSIMHIEQWFKKKSREILQKTFPSLIQQSLRDTSPKNTTHLPTISNAGVPFDFDLSQPDSVNTNQTKVNI